MRSLYVAVLKALSLPRETRLLDAGCGSGVFCELVAHQSVFVTGLDASDALLEFARRRVPQAAYVAGELEQLPFLDASFDVVTGFCSFQYAHAPSKALAEAFRVLSPGGRLVMSAWGWSNRKRALSVRIFYAQRSISLSLDSRYRAAGCHRLVLLAVVRSRS